VWHSTAARPAASACSPMVDKTQQVLCYKQVYLPAGLVSQSGHRRKNKIPHHVLPSNNSQVYYTSDIESLAHVNTTKPYAIVAALPTTGISTQHIIQPVSTKGSVIMASPTLVEKPNPKSPPSYSVVVKEKAKTQETRLISGFDTAWKQLQANGRKYNPAVPSTKTYHPPATSAKGPRLIYGRPRHVNYKPQNSGKIGRVCSLCSNDATYLCSGCKTEWYCGRDCQVRGDQ